MQKKEWMPCVVVAVFLVTFVDGGALPIGTDVLQKWTIPPTGTSSSIKGADLHLPFPSPFPTYAASSSLPILKRRKRIAATTIFAGLSALGGLMSGSGVLTNTILTHQKSGGSNSPQYDTRVLTSIENKLTGVEGKIKNVELTVLESQAETRITSQIIQNLITKGAENSQRNFEVTKGLITQGVLENRFNSAATQGLIAKSNAENEMNFARVQVSIGHLKEFISHEISGTKADIRKGFQSMSNLIELTRIEPLVLKMQNQINDFHQRLNHVQSLPEQNKKDEIERNGGFIAYLESSTLKDDLYDIVHQNIAIPKDAADLQAIFILDLLVNGLQVYVKMISATVSSNVYLAGKALDESKLEEFNLYMLRVRSSTERLKTALGYAENRGLLQEVKEVIDKVHNLPYISNIRGAIELISDKKTIVDQLESDVARLITENTELNDPGTITGKISFVMSRLSTPIGPWQDNKKVSYAIQIVSESGLSKIGEWSTPYTVKNKACPIIMIPEVGFGLVRLVYRRFNEEKPELVAVLDDHTQTMFRDIGRDLLNAAANPNEDISFEETTLLLNDGADTNIWIENKMTPLHYAAKHGNINVMKLLTERGAEVRAKSLDNEEPLHFAALFGTDEGIEYLISKGANSNAQTKLLGLSALHIAVANNHVDAAKALIRKNAFINIKDNYGLTPLHMSIVGNGDTMDVLLESATIDINIAAEDGLTPLHYAVRSTTDVFVRKLLQHNDADVNILTKSHVSPLHFAAMSSNAIVIAALLQQGAVISARDEDGSTPLHYAAFFGNKDAVLTLLQCDPSLAKLKNKNDKTPHDFALENNWQFVAEALTSDFDKLVEIIRNEITENSENHLEVIPPNDSPGEKSPEESSSVQNTSNKCTKDLVNQMAKGSEETCAHIGNVEAYVNLVMSMIPLEVYYENNEEFSQIFRNYDYDLGEAQTHAKIWKNGESIIMGIRQTFELAREFEPEFTRKYKINKDRVKKIKENVDQFKLINQTKDQILNLTKEHQDATEALGKAQVASVLQYLHRITADLQTQLDEKRRMLKEDFSLIPELEELIGFLEFVRMDSSKIRAVAINTREKIETFRDHLVHDKSAFVRHSEIASTAFEKLQNKTIEKNNELAELKKKQDELQENIEVEKKKTADLYTQIQESHEELRQMRRDIMDKMSQANTMKIVGAVLAPFFFGLISIPLLIVASNQEKDLMNQLMVGMDSNRAEIDLLNAQIQSRYGQIEMMRQLIANSSSNSDKVKLEMNVMIHLNKDLKDLSSDVNKLLEAIQKAIVGVDAIKDVFDDVTKKLTEMIEMAKTAKTEAERLNARYFIYYELSLLECNWKDVYLKVMNLDACTRSFQILYI